MGTAGAGSRAGSRRGVCCSRWAGQGSSLAGIWGLELKAPHHEAQQRLPALEVRVAGQGADIVEEGLAGKRLANELVVGIHQPEYGMKQEGQEVEGGEQGREVLLAMPVVWVRW